LVGTKKGDNDEIQGFFAALRMTKVVFGQVLRE